MYQEIEDILLGKLHSKWSQQELAEAWELIFGKSIKRPFNFNKQEIKRLCDIIKGNSNLLRLPDTEDRCPAMWVSVLLFVSFKKLPLFINHPHIPVQSISRWRLGKGK
jgi:hypothetical protein